MWGTCTMRLTALIAAAVMTMFAGAASAATVILQQDIQSLALYASQGPTAVHFDASAALPASGTHAVAGQLHITTLGFPQRYTHGILDSETLTSVVLHPHQD